MSSEDLARLAEAEVGRLQSMIAAQQQISLIHSLAFDNCVKDASSPSLSHAEHSCIADSFARFYDSKNVAMKTMQEKMRPQR